MKNSILLKTTVYILLLAVWLTSAPAANAQLCPHARNNINAPLTISEKSLKSVFKKSSGNRNLPRAERLKIIENYQAQKIRKDIDALYERNSQEYIDLKVNKIMASIKATKPDLHYLIDFFEAKEKEEINNKNLDEWTVNHKKRVMILAYHYGLRFNAVTIPPAVDLGLLVLAARYHDIGKAEIPSHIINKTDGPLTDDEYAIMQGHVIIPYQLPLPNSILTQNLKRIMEEHHESFDGTGYPHKKTGENTTIEAQLLSIVDSGDAMAGYRPYQMALHKAQKSIAATFIDLISNRGTRYAPYLIDLLSIFVSSTEDLPETVRLGIIANSNKFALIHQLSPRLVEPFFPSFNDFNNHLLLMLNSFPPVITIRAIANSLSIESLRHDLPMQTDIIGSSI
ncbi:MAG: HD domain-containing protein [PVC group bacterium]|nr:HD domain-containing protein [PVC group bacterium]